MTPDHEQLLAEMTQYLTTNGYSVMSATYADVCDTASRKMLSSIYSVPATYIRTRADRVAFSAQTGMCFEFDAKTNLTKQGDVFVELLPIVSHYALMKWFGIKTFYGFRWPNIDRDDIGFEIDNDFVDKVEAVFLFDRDCQCEINQWVEHMAPKVFTHASIVKAGRGYGSGDPAVKVPDYNLEDLPHWKDLFKATCGI